MLATDLLYKMLYGAPPGKAIHCPQSHLGWVILSRAHKRLLGTEVLGLSSVPDLTDDEDTE